MLMAVFMALVVVSFQGGDLHASSRGEGDLSSQVAPCGVGVAPWVASRQEAWPREAASLCPSYQEDRASCPAGAGLACPCRLQDASAVRRGVRQEVPQGARREVHQADAPAGVRTPQHQEAGALLDPPVGSSLVAMVLPHHAQVPAVQQVQHRLVQPALPDQQRVQFQDLVQLLE